MLKLWQVRDAFDPGVFFRKLQGGDYDWDDLRRLLRPSERVDAKSIINAIAFHFRALGTLTELEQAIVADARRGARNEELAARLRDEIRTSFG